MSDFAKNAAKSRLTKLASVAASDYLSKEVPLNEAITKLAKEENLTPAEVSRVCESANHEVYASLFNQMEDKTFTFDVADHSQIIEGINKEAGANVCVDPSYKAIDIVDLEDIEKTASPLKKEYPDLCLTGDPESTGMNQKQRLALFLDKVATIHDNLKEEKFNVEMTKEAATVRFINDVKQMFLTKEASLHNIYHNLVDARPDQSVTVAKMIKMAALHMGQKWEMGEFVKEAGCAVDPKLFKEGLSFSGRPLKVINGRQALVMSLDTLITQDAEYSAITKGLSMTGDKVKYLRKKLHNIISEEVKRG